MANNDDRVPTSGKAPRAGRDQKNLPQQPSTVSSLRAMYEAKARTAGAPKAVQDFAKSGNFALVLDATGSMAGLIDDARRSFTEIMSRLKKQGGERVKIRCYIYRDYDCGDRVCESSELTDDPRILSSWLSRISANGGGNDLGEAIEQPLALIFERAESLAVLLAGDEPPHHSDWLQRHGRSNTLTAFDWAAKFGASNIPIHAFVVGQLPETVSDFREIASKSGGQSGRLDGTNAMIDMAVMAMLSKLRGRDAVQRYAEQHKLSNASRDYAQLLLTGPEK